MKKQNWTWSNKARKLIPRNTVYNDGFWCGHCCRKISKTAAKTDHKGTLRCPYCNKPLRTKPRMYGKRKPKASTPGNNANIIHSLAAAELQSIIVVEPIIKPSKQQFSEKPSNYIEENKQSMEGWKK